LSEQPKIDSNIICQDISHYFLNILLGGESDCEELVPNFILNGTKVGQFRNFKEMNYM